MNPASATQLEAEYDAVGSWGRSLHDLVTSSDVGNVPLNGLATIIKNKVIAWAATSAGGSVTITRKEIIIVGLPLDIMGVRKTADESTSSAAFVNCTDLSFQLAANTSYKFKFTGAYTAAAATTGLQLSVNGPGAPTFVRFVGVISTTTTSVFYGVGAAYDAAIANVNSGGATALPFSIEGSITTDATAGLFSLRFRSEVGGSNVTILRGSIGELTEVS
jgi:hypothetical protein